MTAFSLCMPYHNNPEMLRLHYNVLAALPDVLKRGIELVVCDDASDERPPEPVTQLVPPVSIFRIPPPHIPWSHRCATNVAASHARGYWLLLTDIDHLVPSQTWAYLMSPHRAPLKTDVAYTFTRQNMDCSEYKPHPDSWLIHTSLWRSIGGYDTRYRGHYGQNWPWIERVAHHARKTEQLPVPLIRVSRDDIPDASERVLTRKSQEARDAISGLRRAFKRDGTYFAHQPIVPHERVY